MTASDTIENYESNPGPFSFVCECPVDWDKTVYPEAEIGKYITVARKDKNSDSWYIGRATGTDARTARIPLAFLDSGCTYRATIYRDAPEADYVTDPYPVIIEQRDVTADTVLMLPQGRSGGAAVKLSKI